MRIDARTRDPWTILHLDGSLDLDSSPGVYLAFQRDLLRGRTHFLFDLEHVDHLDTSGLGVLVRCYKDARGRGGEVGLRRVPESIERVLEFTRLDAIFRTCGEEPPPVGPPDTEAA